MKKLLLIVAVYAQMGWGWGEVGHHLIARTAVEILKKHPALQGLRPDQSESISSFLTVFSAKQYQQGHVANIPDTFWRNLDEGMHEEGNLLGAPSHYLDSEELLTPLRATSLAEAKIPLTYSETKNKFQKVSNFFKNVGSLPWRAQQFADLYSSALKKLPNNPCSKNKKGELETRVALTFAGLLSHYTGDVSMPYHTTIDHDGIAVGQKGIHSYFEQDLVSELEISDLFQKVSRRADTLLSSREPRKSTPSIENLNEQSRSIYPDADPKLSTSALMMMVANDSYSLIEKLRQLDYTYSIASLNEALNMPECQNLKVVRELKNQFDTIDKNQQTIFGKVKVLSFPASYEDKKSERACRRKPGTKVNEDGDLSSSGKTVAEWHEELIIERLALSAALTAEIWVRNWITVGAPNLCSSYLYAHKPSFVSPTDPQCFGYALNENPKHFLKKDGKTALNTFKKRRHTADCVSF